MVAQEPDRLGERGRIISIGSVFGARGFSNTAVYSATKAGLVGATRSLAVECAPHRILVNVINPGTVVTGMTSGLPEPVESCLEQKALLGFGSTDDTAGAAVFLASAEAKWITGQDLFVDGGYTIS